MAKILIAFYNGLYDKNDLSVMPSFYETFINGLKEAGNETLVFMSKFWGVDHGEIKADIKKEILEYSPDVCFLFNNAFYDLSNVVDCPIVIYEVDSPRYYFNKKSIKKCPNRYLYFIAQETSRKILMEEFAVANEKIFVMPFFTEIHADTNIPKTANISFIGSAFTVSSTENSDFNRFLNDMSESDWKVFAQCLKDISQNPQVTMEELIAKNDITSEFVKKNLKPGWILHMLSDEKRIDVLAAISNLGLNLYGTENWRTTYYHRIMLNLCFKKKYVYSLEHNATIYNQSRIGISISHMQAVSGFPWRVMDIMASSACLVTDYHSDFEKYFPEVIKFLPIFSNPCEAYNICKNLIEDETRRDEIILQCNEVIDNRFRFKHACCRMEEYLNVNLRNL